MQLQRHCPRCRKITSHLCQPGVDICDACGHRRAAGAWRRRLETALLIGVAAAILLIVGNTHSANGEEARPWLKMEAKANGVCERGGARQPCLVLASPGEPQAVYFLYIAADGTGPVELIRYEMAVVRITSVWRRIEIEPALPAGERR